MFFQPQKMCIRVRTSPRSGPGLMNDEVIRLAKEYLRGQIPALLTAEAIRNGDRLEREFVDAHRYIPAASFAGDDELLAVCRSLEHGINYRRRLGENGSWHNGGGEVRGACALSSTKYSRYKG